MATIWVCIIRFNFKKSEENYKQSILYDKNIIAYYNLGNLYQDQNDLFNAEKIISQTSSKPNMLQALKTLFIIDLIN